MKLGWLTDSYIEKGYRAVKMRITKSLIYSSKVAYPFGFASNPTKKQIAIRAETGNKSDSIIVGFLDPNALAGLGLGDSLQYATDENGNKTATLILRADGTAEIIGDTDNAVRYSELNNGLQNHTSQIQAELTKIQTAIGTLGGTYAPGTLSMDISNSKVDEIKIP